MLHYRNGGLAIDSTSADGWIAVPLEEETILWPQPGTAETPFHLLPYEELLARLRASTNIRVVPDADAESGYRVDTAEFPGWKDLPSW